MVKDRGDGCCSLWGRKESDRTERRNNGSDSKPEVTPNQEQVPPAEAAAVCTDGLQLRLGGQQSWGIAPGQNGSQVPYLGGLPVLTVGETESRVVSGRVTGILGLGDRARGGPGVAPPGHGTPWRPSLSLGFGGACGSRCCGPSGTDAGTQHPGTHQAQRMFLVCQMWPLWLCGCGKAPLCASRKAFPEVLGDRG